MDDDVRLVFVVVGEFAFLMSDLTVVDLPLLETIADGAGTAWKLFFK